MLYSYADVARKRKGDEARRGTWGSHYANHYANPAHNWGMTGRADTMWAYYEAGIIGGNCMWGHVRASMAPYSKTAGCRFDSCPTCPYQSGIEAAFINQTVKPLLRETPLLRQPLRQPDCLFFVARCCRFVPGAEQLVQHVGGFAL